MADIKRLFVSAEMAKRAYEIGFSEECLAWYPAGDSGIGRLVLGRVRLFDEEFSDGPHDWTGQPIPMPGDPFYPAPTYQQLIDWLAENWLAENAGIQDSVLRIINLYSGPHIEPRINKAINILYGKK
jgi:hypothetical protein